jgi:hypothetical protein
LRDDAPRRVGEDAVLVLTDQEIYRLLTVAKPAVEAKALLQSMKPDARQMLRAEIEVEAGSGDRFMLRLRQSAVNPFDFSVILSYLPDGVRAINLRRHNGNTHMHTNPIEKTTFAGAFHIHQATERYRDKGHDVEHYAEETERFADLATALTCMLDDANFASPAQMTIL